MPPTPGTPRPGIPSEPSRSAIGFALDGAVIVCAWLTSLSVSEKLRLIFETDEPALAGGRDRQRHGQLGEEVVVGVRVDIDRGGL